MNNEYTARAQRANENLLQVVGRLKDPTGPWEVVRPARWKNLETGVHVETGYSYGEGVIRVYLTGTREMTERHTLNGRPNDLDALRVFFPA